MATPQQALGALGEAALIPASFPVGRADGGSRLAISDDGSKIYMSDPDKSRLDVLDVAKGQLSFIGGPGAAPGQFGIPSGVAVGPDGKVYVVDSKSNSVQVFSLK